ncbi:MAG: DUF4760 domain-containing protein [Pseudomonadota bacterium]|nr:DUF4760 domain-containing protein [Pseudomonadota bacterium]
MAGTIAINISKRQKAVELLQAIKMDRRVDKGLSTLRNIHDDSNIEVEFYGYAAQADSNEAKRIRYLLNTFEQLASGISDDIYDETIIKRSKYTTIVNTYKRASKFIDKVQESQPTAYQELKALSEKWKAKPLKEKGRIEKLLRALRII